MARKPSVYIGTSGFSYKGWHERFYPEDLKQADLLSFFSQNFNAVEINSSFYHLPLRKTVQKWVGVTPAGFRFCMKVSRFITHQKKLVDSADYVPAFIDAIQDVAGKKGPLLLQLPPSLKPQFDRLDDTLRAFRENGHGHRWPIAVEFRHPDWYGAELNALLDRHGAGLVLHDMPGSEVYESSQNLRFIYMRFHGPTGDYGGRYGARRLKKFAKILGEARENGKTIYAFFNNDRDGYAIEDARTLRAMLDKDATG